MKNIYIITASRGDCEDYSFRTIFATESEELAKAYCEKANTIWERYFDYYSGLAEELYLEYKYHYRDGYRIHVIHRRNKLDEEFSYEKVELRY